MRVTASQTSRVGPDVVKLSKVKPLPLQLLKPLFEAMSSIQCIPGENARLSLSLIVCKKLLLRPLLVFATPNQDHGFPDPSGFHCSRSLR